MDDIKFNAIDDAFWSDEEQATGEPEATAPPPPPSRPEKEKQDDVVRQFSSRVLGGQSLDRNSQSSGEMGRKKTKDFGARAADTMNQALTGVMQQYYDPPLVQDIPRSRHIRKSQNGDADARRRKIQQNLVKLGIGPTRDATSPVKFLAHLRPSQLLRSHHSLSSASGPSETGGVYKRPKHTASKRKKRNCRIIFRTRFDLLSSDDEGTEQKSSALVRGSCESFTASCCTEKQTIVSTTVTVPAGLMIPLPTFAALPPIADKSNTTVLPFEHDNKTDFLPRQDKTSQLLSLFLSSRGLPALQREELDHRSLIINQQLSTFCDMAAEMRTWYEHHQLDANASGLTAVEHTPEVLLGEYKQARYTALDSRSRLPLGENSFGMQSCRSTEQNAPDYVMPSPLPPKFHFIELVLSHQRELLSHSIFSPTFAVVNLFRLHGRSPPLLSLVHPLFADLREVTQNTEDQRLVQRLKQFSTSTSEAPCIRETTDKIPLRLRPSTGLCSLVVVAEQQILCKYSKDEYAASLSSETDDVVDQEPSAGDSTIKEYFRWEPHPVEPFREISVSDDFQFEYFAHAPKPAKPPPPADDSPSTATSPFPPVLPDPIWLPTRSAFNRGVKTEGMDATSQLYGENETLLHQLSHYNYRCGNKLSRQKNTWLRQLEQEMQKSCNTDSRVNDVRQSSEADFYNLIIALVQAEVDLVWVPFLAVFSCGASASALQQFFHHYASASHRHQSKLNSLIPHYYGAKTPSKLYSIDVKQTVSKVDDRTHVVRDEEDVDDEKKAASSFASVATRLIIGRSSITKNKADHTKPTKSHDMMLTEKETLQEGTDSTKECRNAAAVENEDSASNASASSVCGDEPTPESSFSVPLPPRQRQQKVKLDFVDGQPRSDEFLRRRWHRGPWCYGFSGGEAKANESPMPEGGRSRWPTASEERDMIQNSLNIGYRSLLLCQMSSVLPQADDRPLFSHHALSDTYSWYAASDLDVSTDGDSVRQKIDKGAFSVRRRLWARMVINPGALDEFVAVRQGHMAAMHTELNVCLEKEAIERLFSSEFMRWWTAQ